MKNWARLTLNNIENGASKKLKTTSYLHNSKPFSEAANQSTTADGDTADEITTKSSTGAEDIDFRMKPSVGGGP